MVGSGATTLSVNGGHTQKSKGVGDPVSMEITDALHPGANVLAGSVTAGESGSPALIGAIELNLADGTRVVIHTDGQWRASASEAPEFAEVGFDDSSWEMAKVLGPYGMAPWGEVGWAWRTVLPARMLRKDFTAPAQVKRATLYIAGLGLFEAYLNGTKVSQDVLVPALSEYEKRVNYRTYDVSNLLRPGANAIGVMLGNGRFFPPRHNIPTVMRGFGYPKLRLQLEMELADGKVERVVSDESWKLTTDGPIRANNEYDGETYDARKEMDGWCQPGFQATPLAERPDRGRASRRPGCTVH